MSALKCNAFFLSGFLECLNFECTSNDTNKLLLLLKLSSIFNLWRFRETFANPLHTPNVSTITSKINKKVLIADRENEF